MGGIVGAFALDGRQVAAADVQRMAAASAFPPCDPLISSSHTIVWFDGRLDNPEVDGLSDRALVLAAYERHAENFARELNGDFAVAVMDETRRRLILARDVMGAQPLYYCPLPGLLLFASRINSLLAHPDVTAAPDEDGLAELVLDYWCDEHLTCFKGIYSVPPGDAIVVTPDRIERREQWRFDPARQIRYRSFDEYRDHFKSLFEQSVRRRLRSARGVAVTVSGGLDSSSIFCQAAQLRHRETLDFALHGISLTFPAGSLADEHEFLDTIERTYDIPIARLPVTRWRYVENADVAVRHLDTPGEVGDAELEICETARRCGCDVLLSGFFGDQMLFDRGYLVDLVRHGRWLKVRHDLMEFKAWLDDPDPDFFHADFWSRVIRGVPPGWLFRIARRVLQQSRAEARYPPWFTTAFRQRATARAATRFDQPRRFATAHAEQYYRHATAGHYRDAVRCERAVAEAYGLDLRYPFRDRDLVAFLMAIPGEIVNWQGVPKGLLRHALSGVLPDTIRDRRSKADFTALDNDSMRRDVARVAATIGHDSLCVRAGIVDADALDRMVGTLASLNDDVAVLPGWRLTDVIGLEVWLRERCTA